jgi:hypothetical protein
LTGTSVGAFAQWTWHKNPFQEWKGHEQYEQNSRIPLRVELVATTHRQWVGFTEMLPGVFLVLIFFFLRWSGIEPTITEAITGLLYQPRNTSTIALRVVRGDVKGTQ